MKINEVSKECLPTIKTPTLQQLAKKHNVSLESLKKQLKMGIKVETEHSTSKKLAKEIALDHLNEKPDYYDDLEKMERNGYSESATGGSTSAGNIASIASPTRGIQRRSAPSLFGYVEAAPKKKKKTLKKKISSKLDK